ncbi:glycosyltransferase family 2 protein [Hyunsoonleella pacifica]|uniref:Glycosyltransferase family 2 protein n=1 Tax=Hyunsoonleella pacifica TaxID=1080224 RepID=A0A4Q9FUE7_9FLAO|nr:glycosyltransferase family 2 protein [Hyunsoonleella pacifica]TBN18909.1 glycosyltransferase family 2 protein [Hyunsoonleella pacifica]GGD05783.1 glycosyl transferase [Hyunsoonleella pacifica]
MKQPLVSILTPFKNTERFLSECLNSILEQTYTNWELLIIDDHSTDNSYDLVEKFAKNDSRIQLLKNNGNGIIDALQMGFKYSSGTFVTRMDSDDIMLPNKLEVLAKNLINHGKSHIAVGLVKYFNANGVGPGYKDYEIWLNNLTKSGNNYSEIYKECVIPSPCWMAHRYDLEACNAFNPNVYPEDYDLTFRFYKHHYKCIPCNDVIHKWRDYSTRTSRTHIHYAQNHFTTLKVEHFLDIDYNPEKTLVIWGAGTKGKLMASIFIQKGIAFKWICDNPNKIGKEIYGKQMLSFNALANIKNPQSLITVANKEAQKEIRAYLNNLNLQAFKDYIFFC